MTPTFAHALGAVDGANVEFATTSAYVVGTVVPCVNGLLDPALKFSEGPGNLFTLTTAPLAGDSVEVFYMAAV